MQRTVGGRCGILMVCLAITVSVMAQRPMYGKMSTFVRSLVMQTAHNAADATTRADLLANKADDDWLCAFVRFTDNNPALADQYGITLLAQIGDVCIARIPIASLGALSREPSVVRIEANRTCRVAMDTRAVCLRADKAYEGNKLPQAYTGKGVVVGVQDIGFDLSHPTFSNGTGSQYRIKALWDQLAPQAETASDNVPVGVVYEGEGALKSLAHSYDGNDCTHGTHTTGIAAGSGFNAAYRGVAYESDICLVANATGDNMPGADG